MTVNDAEYSPDPYAHAVRHLDAAEDMKESTHLEEATVDALIGIGWALLAIAKKE
jgi:hypothetical protein